VTKIYLPRQPKVAWQTRVPPDLGLPGINPLHHNSDVARKLAASGAKLREWKSIAVSGLL
jgi:hypothetical protein